MKNKTLTLTLVIPVYNEENHIKACLESVARQSVIPDEVLVIDNNCTDNTVVIARSFPFVKVINEKTQGLIAARNRGFNEAKGSILGRIDADAVLDPDWVARVHKDFIDPELMGLTGPAKTNTFPFVRGLKTRIWPVGYFIWREGMFGVGVLWGANMAIRRTAWLKIKNAVCLIDQEVHEDQDLSFLLAGAGLKILRDNKLIITTEGEHYHDWPKFYEYTMRGNHTKRYHNQKNTIRNKEALRLGLWSKMWRDVAVFLPSLVFAGSSFVLWLPYYFAGKIKSLINR